ncbi:MAG TPA: helix-turn-helix domain-containing protein, partial [Solirubrobacteraceae bacterium]
ASVGLLTPGTGMGAIRKVSATVVEAADRLLSPNEAAQILGLSAYTVRQLARDRKIPAIRLGRYWRFRKSSLEAWISEQERAPR